MWRPAVRVDLLGTRQAGPTDTPLHEHGNAFVVALNWRPLEHLRVVARLYF